MSDRGALSLEVRVGDQIAIGDDILLTVEDKSGKVARLRFLAPSEVRIRKKDNTATVHRIMRERGVIEK